MSTLKLAPAAVTIAARVGKEVRIIFAERNAAAQFMQDMTKTQQGWKTSDSYMSLRTSWPQRRKKARA